MFLYTFHVVIGTLLQSLSSDPASRDQLEYFSYMVLKNFCKISRKLSRKSVMSAHASKD